MGAEYDATDDDSAKPKKIRGEKAEMRNEKITFIKKESRCIIKEASENRQVDPAEKPFI